jgi:hypothetical protein
MLQRSRSPRLLDGPDRGVDRLSGLRQALLLGESRIDESNALKLNLCQTGGRGTGMKARQLIGSASFQPDELKVIFEAFDDAWGEVGTDVTGRVDAIDTARLSLATIVLNLAAAGPIERVGLKTAAVDAFRLKHRLT